MGGSDAAGGASRSFGFCSTCVLVLGCLNNCRHGRVMMRRIGCGKQIYFVKRRFCVYFLREHLTSAQLKHFNRETLLRLGADN